MHVEDGIEGTETEEFGDDRCARSWRKDFGAGCALLGRKDAHPDFIGFGARGPELKETLEIAGLVCNLAGDGAVDRNGRLRKILQYTLVSRRCAANIVFGLQPVYGDYDVEAFEVGPVRGNRAEGAGDDLGMNAAAVELGQDGFKFAISDEGVTADEGDMERFMLVDYAENVFDECVFFIVRQLAKGNVAFPAEMGRIEGIATGTAEGTFASDLDR